MIVLSAVRTSAYFDSAALMLAQRAVRRLPGVADAGLVMGTEASKELLRAAGLLTPEADLAGPNDLILTVSADSAETAATALTRAQELLTARRSPTPAAYRPRTVTAAARALDGANVALISVPGRFAAGVAREALAAGLHTMIFSDNVALEAEVELKRFAATHGLLVMGPDCGTTILGGVALGFGNRVRRGSIGIVASAGTGIQEVTSLIHRYGGGISHAIGTGARDLSAPVGGVTTLLGLAALAEDPGTSVIVLISKPPAREVAARVLGAAARLGKPVVVHIIGAEVAVAGRLHAAGTLDEAARTAVGLSSGVMPAEPEEPASEAGVEFAASQKYIRGLYSGGTLCYEALVLLEPYVGPVYSNTPLDPAHTLASPMRSTAHTVVDMGSDEFTVGRLHPMLDPELRVQRLLREAEDPEVAVLLLDVVLGFGAHPDPAGALAPAIRQVREQARAQGRRLPVIVAVCGTDGDPQGYAAQVRALTGAGAIGHPSNTNAVRHAGLIARAAGATGSARAPMSIGPSPQAEPLPGVVEVLRLLGAPPRVVNVGLDLFAESLAAQGAAALSMDWRPPAGGDQRMMDLLEKLGG